MTVFNAAPLDGSRAAESSAVSVETASEQVEHVVVKTTEWSRTTVTAASNRKVPLAVVEKRQDRWEVEVSRSVGSRVCKTQSVKERITDRTTMKSAGAYVAKFVATGGTGVDPEESEAARDRVRKRRLEEKKEAVAAEAAQAAERAAKMAAKRTKAKQARLRHELHLRETEERRIAKADQAKADQEVVRELRTRRAEIHQALVEDGAGADLESALQYAMPAPWVEAAYSGDDAAIQNLMRKGARASQRFDDETIQRLVGAEDLDDAEMRRLIGDKGADAVRRQDEDALRRLLGKDNVDDDIIRSIMGKGKDTFQADRDDEAFRFILDNAANHDEAQANALALRTLAGLRHIDDPISGASTLAYRKPRAKSPGVVPQAARDMDILNTLMEESNDYSKPRDLHAEVQAWKDIGAVNMLMEGLPGVERRNRHSDDDVMEALLSARSLTPTAQADNRIMQQLLAPNDSFPHLGYREKVSQHGARHLQTLPDTNMADQLALQQLMESNEDVSILQDLMKGTPVLSDLQTMRDIDALNMLIR